MISLNLRASVKASRFPLIMGIRQHQRYIRSKIKVVAIICVYFLQNYSFLVFRAVDENLVDRALLKGPPLR